MKQYLATIIMAIVIGATLALTNSGCTSVVQINIGSGTTEAVPTRGGNRVDSEARASADGNSASADGNNIEGNTLEGVPKI